MKTKDADQKQDPQTRLALIDAAVHLIGEHGYDGASIGDIAAYTEVTKGAVYYHFNSKEDFVLEILRQRSTENIAQFRKLDKKNTTLGEWIERSFSAIIGFSDPAQQLFLLQVMMAGTRPEHARIGKLVAEIHTEWRSLIAEMVMQSDEYQKGQILGDPEVIAVGIMALIDGLLIHFRLEPATFTEQAFIERLAPLLKQWVLQSASGA